MGRMAGAELVKYQYGINLRNDRFGHQVRKYFYNDILSIRTNTGAIFAVTSYPKEWAMFNEHYLPKEKAHVVCTGSGCKRCDADMSANPIVLVGGYCEWFTMEGYSELGQDHGPFHVEDAGNCFLRLNERSLHNLLEEDPFNNVYLVEKKKDRFNNKWYTFEEVYYVDEEHKRHWKNKIKEHVKYLAKNDLRYNLNEAYRR